MESITAITVPTLVMSGDRDEPESGQHLAALLRHAVYLEVPGDHVSASSSPELGDAMAGFFD